MTWGPSINDMGFIYSRAIGPPVQILRGSNRPVTPETFEANNFRYFRDFLRFAKIKFAKIISNTVQNGRIIKFAKINSVKMIFGRIRESLLPRKFLAIRYDT